MKEFQNLFYIVIGALILAFSTVTFLTPNNLITGGGIGIAQLFYTLFPSITLGIWITLISVPLMLAGMTFFGKTFVLRTLLAIGLISVFSDLFQEVLQLPRVTDEPILASIFGGLLIGLGVGFVMRGKSSTGGTTILAEIVSNKTRHKTSEILLAIDAVTMFSSIFVYNDVQKALFSVLGVYVATRIIGLLLSGSPSQKSVTISSKNAELLSKEIAEHLGEHGTLVKGRNLLQSANRTLLFVIVDFSKLQLLKEIVGKHDQDALLIVQEASELHGRDY